MARTPVQAPGLRIGSLRGVPIFIGRSWLLIAFVIVVTFGPQVRKALPDLGGVAYVVAFAYVVGLLISVLVHEAAHALAGQWRGFEVHQIVADLWGGHTSFTREGTTARSSAIVAVVGPLSNAVLAVIGYAALQLDLPDVARLLIAAFTWANALVAAFNLLPGFPLDGGHLVEAAVWGATGNRTKGTVIAGWCGRVVTLAIVAVLLVWPLINGKTLSLVTTLWVVLIASFMWFGASAAIARGKVTGQLGTVPLGDILRPLAAAPVGASVAELPPHDTVLMGDDGHPEGFVVAGSAMAVPMQNRTSTPASALLIRPSGPWVVQLEGDGNSGGDLNALVTNAAQHGQVAERTVVLQRDGQPLGWIARDDLIRAVHSALQPRRNP
ncbi:site-2 protease family protein [Yimella sp. cx-573]|nr:site-2 protease family protein [Yimella sp. cx-573]